MIRRRDGSASDHGRGCAGRLGCLALIVLLLVAAGAWLARDSLGGWMAELELGGSMEPSERLASEAERKLDAIARGGLGEEVRFSEAELQSLLVFRAGPALPPGIEEPRVDVQDSIIVLSARLLPEQLQGFSAPDAVRSALSDSARVITGLLPVVEQPGEVLVRVRSLQMGSVVIPPIMLPAVVGSLERQGVPTSDGAVVVRVPRNIGGVRIEGDDVVLEPDLSPR